MKEDVIALFQEVADLPAAEREEYYNRERLPADIRESVESLLRFDRGDQNPVRSLVGRAAGDALLDVELEEGSRCGPYRLIRLIGRGGMGAVYEAEQDNPRRVVALKVIRPGLSTPQLVRRFERESQVLGRLHHPGIAQIYEAGTREGELGPQPYFVMELVHGQPLKEYCESRGLNFRQRLDLIAAVAEAVHHAHQRGIIHRDLKPGNILVEENGQPKILDFGVAVVTDSDAQATRQSDAGQLIGTLAYMSPEQVLADPLELDTRTDVYSLGVILYELLAGRLPYQTEGHLPNVLQAIREAEAPPLSMMDRAYRGDISTITGKALEKDKRQRYGSAAAFASDIKRYLQDEPITARRPSLPYQLHKFARRHKGLVGGMAAVFVVLVAGVIVSLSLARRADREAAVAKAVSEFLQNDLLSQASAAKQARPDTKPDPDLKVRTALDRAAARIPGRFDKQPLVEAAIRQTMMYTYRDLGLFPEAQRHTERAIELRSRVLGQDHADTVASRNSLAELLVEQARYAEAEGMLTKILAARKRILGESHADTIATMNKLGEAYQLQGKYTDAEPLFVKALDVQRRTYGDDDEDTPLLMNGLAAVYRLQGKHAQAEELLRKVLEVSRRINGREHPNTLTAINNLAVICMVERKYAEAEPLLVEALDLRRRILGAEHPATLRAMNNLAAVYLQQYKFDEAEPLAVQGLATERRVLGEEHPTTVRSMSSLGVLYTRRGKYEEAEPLLTRAVDIQRRKLGEKHPETLVIYSNLAGLHQAQGRYSHAGVLRSKVYETRRSVLGEDHPDTLLSLYHLGVFQRIRHNYAEAEQLLRAVVEKRSRVLGAQHPDTRNSMAALGECLLEERRYSDAEKVLREAVAAYGKAATGPWDRYDAMSLLGAVLAAKKSYAEAEPLLVGGYEGLQQTVKALPAVDRVRLERAAVRVADLYQAWGQAEKAATWRAKVNARQIAAVR